MKTATINGRLVYYFDTRFFEIEGRKLEIVGTGTHNGETVHRIKGQKETKTVKHSTLIQLFKNKKLKT